MSWEQSGPLRSGNRKTALESIERRSFYRAGCQPQPRCELYGINLHDEFPPKCIYRTPNPLTAMYELREAAFCELGRVVRTIFLLRFVSDEEMRRTIHAATNTAEAWNGFVQWVAFGGEGVIRQNSREEQRKIIRYNHLVANLVVFHNVVAMTRVLQALVDEGYSITPEILARLAPYKIGHINRFGTHDLCFDRVPPPIVEELRLVLRSPISDRARG